MTGPTCPTCGFVWFEGLVEVPDVCLCGEEMFQTLCVIDGGLSA